MIRQQSLSDLIQKVEAFKRIDLSRVSPEGLRSALDDLMEGYPMRGERLASGQRLYRGVVWSEKPVNVAQLGYPPAEVVKSLGRANNVGTSLFYCSVSFEAVHFEIPLRVGDRLAVSEWEAKEEGLIQTAGFPNAEFWTPGSPRYQRIERPDPQLLTPEARYVNHFLAETFSRHVPKGSEHLYKASIAIAEKLFSAKVNGWRSSQFDGIKFPAVSNPTRRGSDNFVLSTAYCDRSLAVRSVRWIEVTEVDAKANKILTNASDFANSFGPAGEIEWKGRGPQITGDDTGKGLLSMVDGLWQVRTAKGLIPHT